MKKSIIALAVAGAVAAPAAMADVTLYGGVAVDYINLDTGAGSNSNIQRDDVIIGLKGSSETDGGLMVGGEIKTEGDFANPTLAYLNVGNGMATLWAGKFGSPANNADSADFSDTGNKTYFAGELDNAVAITVASNGFSAGLGAFDNGANVDGTAAQVGYTAGGVSVNVGYQSTEGTDTTGIKVGYAADALSVAAYSVSEDAAGTETSTVGVTGSYTMGATSVSAVIAQDDYDLWVKMMSSL
jgi:hypothetical protein